MRLDGSCALHGAREPFFEHKRSWLFGLEREPRVKTSMLILGARFRGNRGSIQFLLHF